MRRTRTSLPLPGSAHPEDEHEGQQEDACHTEAACQTEQETGKIEIHVTPPPRRTTEPVSRSRIRWLRARGPPRQGGPRTAEGLLRSRLAETVRAGLHPGVAPEVPVGVAARVLVGGVELLRLLLGLEGVERVPRVRPRLVVLRTLVLAHDLLLVSGLCLRLYYGHSMDMESSDSHHADERIERPRLLHEGDRVADLRLAHAGGVDTEGVRVV